VLNLFTLIVQIAVILSASRIVGVVFRRMHQPQVMGEMVAGIMLGPSLLGWLAPRVSGALFPTASLGYLNGLSQVGLVLFMFLIGLTLNPKELHNCRHAAVLASHMSIIAPFTMAAALSLFLYPRLSDTSVSFTSFALFMGSAMSITAFPVLARILSERNLLHTRVGTLSIACAAVDDITGWCILAYIVVLVRAARSATPVWVTLGGSALFVLVMVFGVRRLLKHLESWYLKRGELTENITAAIVVFALASALATEALGIHLLFGAFLAGSIMPKGKAFVSQVTGKFETVTVVLLLPLFFAVTGLRTRVGLLTNREMWAYCLIIIAVAVVGKLGGSMIAARVAGMPWRDSAALGILMNTRGLMELVILNIGLDIGVVSPALFSMMVLMALVTTFMTTPLLHMVLPSLEPVSTAPRMAAEAASRKVAECGALGSC
jgi:Kef-type K+ transport system membrane component KefB